MKTNFVVLVLRGRVCRSTQFFSRIFFRKFSKQGRAAIEVNRSNNSKATRFEIFPFHRENELVRSDRFEIVEGLHLELSTNDNNNFGRSCIAWQFTRPPAAALCTQSATQFPMLPVNISGLT